MCSSRLAFDSAGRLVVIATTADSVTKPGDVFLVLNVFALGWFVPRGRRPTVREQAEARAPYRSAPTPGWALVSEVPDDELDEKAALEAARREQQREPADLFRPVAA